MDAIKRFFGHDARESPRGALRSSIGSAVMIVAWAVTYTVGKSAIENGWLPPAVAHSISIAVGVVMILTFRWNLRVLDELQRKIQLDALALSLGIAVVACGYLSLREAAGAAGSADPDDVLVLIAVSYVGGVLWGLRRYL